MPHYKNYLLLTISIDKFKKIYYNKMGDFCQNLTFIKNYDIIKERLYYI